MRRIIYFVFLLVVIFITGCTKEYNLIVEDDKITEEFNVIVDDNEENNQRLNLDYFPLHATEDFKYDKKIEKRDGMLSANFKYIYKSDEFVNANSISSCFGNREIVVDNDKYFYFKLSNVQECMSDYNLDINIITENKVLTNNADQKNGNKYTWHLSNENKDSFNLEISIEKKNIKSKNNTIFGVIITVIVFVVIAIGAYLLLKRKKINSI